MLEVAIYALVAGAIVWFGISIYERIQEQRRREAETIERLAKEKARKDAETAYIREEAQKFAAALYDGPVTKRTIESPSRVVKSNVIHVSERKLQRDAAPTVTTSDTYCEEDCVPLVDTRNAIAVDAAFALAEQVLHRDEKIFVPGGGQFDGGGASDSYDECFNDGHDRLRAAAEAYEAPSEPSYSEPDSSSSDSSSSDDT